MKNMLKICFLFILCFCLFGCSKANNYSCSRQEDNIRTDLLINAKNDEINTLNITYTYSYEDDDAYIDMKKKELEEEFSIYNDIDDISYKIKENYSDIVVTVKINKNADIKYNFNLPFYRNDNIDLIFTNLLNNGYTCD